MLWADAKGKAWADLDDAESLSDVALVPSGVADSALGAGDAFGMTAEELDWMQSGVAHSELRAAVHVVSNGTVDLQVFVKTLTGKTITLDVAASDTVVAAKAKIEAKTGLPVTHQRLRFAGKQLDDDAVLCEVGVEK